MTDDEAAIHQIVKQLETAWNTGDSAAFGAPFTDDADFVDLLGRHHQGRAVIEAGHREIFNTIYRGSQNHYTVESIRFVRADVAIAFTRARLLSRLSVAVNDPDRSLLRMGETMHEDQARPTLILSKEQGRWQIIAFQNTRIAALRHPP